jgi:hypothetical protein
MANTDPVSGLMASMSRVRNRAFPDTTAAQAQTAGQAGTLPTIPKTTQPTPASSFEQVLPVPQAQTPPQTAVNAPQSAVQGEGNVITPEWVARVGQAFMDVEDGLNVTDAYMLSLGYLNGVRREPRMQTGDTMPPSTLPSSLI